MKQAETYQYSATHMDTARNSTYDFNLFHDKKRWLEIRNNPFQGPIALGFQLLGLVAEKVRQRRLVQNGPRGPQEETKGSNLYLYY